MNHPDRAYQSIQRTFKRAAIEKISVHFFWTEINLISSLIKMRVFFGYFVIVCAKTEIQYKISDIIEKSRATGQTTFSSEDFETRGLKRSRRFFASPFSSYLKETRALVNEQKCSSRPCQKTDVKWKIKVLKIEILGRNI